MCGGEGKHRGKKAQLEDLDVKSKMAAVQRGFYPRVNAAIAESRLSSLATLYYSFHTFEFFHLPREERGGGGGAGGRQIKPPSTIDAPTPRGPEDPRTLRRRIAGTQFATHQQRGPSSRGFIVQPTHATCSRLRLGGKNKTKHKKTRGHGSLVSTRWHH